MNSGQDMNNPKVQDAWAAYLAETAHARDAYDQANAAAIAARDNAYQAADHDRHVSIHQAWETCTDMTTRAWAEYMAATEPARRARDFLIEEATNPALLP